MQKAGGRSAFQSASAARHLHVLASANNGLTPVFHVRSKLRFSCCNRTAKATMTIEVGGLFYGGAAGSLDPM